MSAEQNITTMRRVIEEGFSKGNLEALNDCFGPGYRENQFDLAEHPNLEGFKSAIRSLRNTFPDFNLTIEDLAAQEDRVWVRMTARGHHTGPLMGRPPTGRPFEVAVFDVCRFNQDGKIVEHWGAPDRFHMLLQLGLLPQGRPEPHHEAN
jgi:predicted ester cyclase